jgi:hypothetical protein
MTIKKMTPDTNRDLIDHNLELLNIQLRMAMWDRTNTAIKGTIIMPTAHQSTEAISMMTMTMTVKCGNLLVGFAWMYNRSTCS